MEKILEIFGKEHAKNWWLFTTCFGIVHTCFFWHGFDIGNKNAVFLFLEITLLSTGLARILVAINFLHLVQNCPVIADIINFCWWERRKRLSKMYKHLQLWLTRHDYLGYFKCVASSHGGNWWESVDVIYVSTILNGFRPGLLEHHLKLCRTCSNNEANAYRHIVRTERRYIQEFEKVAQITYSTTGSVMPSFVMRFIHKELHGYFLQKLWLPKVQNVVGKRKFDATLMMIVAVWIILI